MLQKNRLDSHTEILSTPLLILCEADHKIQDEATQRRVDTLSCLKANWGGEKSIWDRSEDWYFIHLSTRRDSLKLQHEGVPSRDLPAG